MRVEELADLLAQQVLLFGEAEVHESISGKRSLGGRNLTLDSRAVRLASQLHRGATHEPPPPTTQSPEKTRISARRCEAGSPRTSPPIPASSCRRASSRWSRSGSSTFLREWQRKVFDAGYLGLDWPAEYGGKGDPLKRQRIVSQELNRAGAPFLVNVIGLQWAGPTILAVGNEEQKKRYLKPILSAEEIWCQGFSEPGAGSDLASLTHASPKRPPTAGSSPATRCGRRSRTSRSG